MQQLRAGVAFERRGSCASNGKTRGLQLYRARVCVCVCVDERTARARYSKIRYGVVAAYGISRERERERERVVWPDFAIRGVSAAGRTWLEGGQGQRE